MTLPYPDSPDIDENIATSIERIKDNFEYLEGAIGTQYTKMVSSANVELSTKSGVANITDPGFEPKAMVVYANFNGGNSFSWGVVTKHSTTLSADCACIFGDMTGSCGMDTSVFLKIYQGTTSVVQGSVSLFTSTGARICWDNTSGGGTPGGSKLNILYFFFG